MIDAREQIAGALLGICGNVKMSRPDGDVELPLICYACTGNTPVNVAYDRLKWRVAVYANTFEDLLGLVAKVDAVMSGQLGYTRTYTTPDDEARKGTDFYMARMDFSALVDTKNFIVLKGST